jgi:hypothetical protein
MKLSAYVTQSRHGIFYFRWPVPLVENRTQPVASGSRLTDLEPEQDGCCECDGGQEYLWAPVVARRHAAPVFQATEHNLDPVAAFVSTLVVFDGLGSGLPARDARLYLLVLRGFTKPVRVIAWVGQKPLRRWKTAQQCCRAGIIADLACGHEEADWSAILIRDSMQFGPSRRLCQSSAGQQFMPPLGRPPSRDISCGKTLPGSDQTTAPPFCNPRLEAVRCALTLSWFGLAPF